MAKAKKCADIKDPEKRKKCKEEQREVGHKKKGKGGMGGDRHRAM